MRRGWVTRPFGDAAWVPTITLVWVIYLLLPRFSVGMSSASAIPTWEHLGQTLKIDLTAPPPVCIDCLVQRDGKSSIQQEPATKRVRLFRERNGWCVYSARLWLALEIKGIAHDTILVEARGDTYDGSMDNEASDGCPDFLAGCALPILQYPNDIKLYEASTESSSLELLQQLDVRFPESIQLFSTTDENNQAEEILAMAKAFGESLPANARASPRAAWLFCQEEGYRLDALPRSSFEQFLNEAERLLSKHDKGPFFCGPELTAADIIWAPLLERYSVQLPCLHRNLLPRGDATTTTWPNLLKWYHAMDKIPAYACRIRGDAASWRKVLHVDPWWPKADLWHPRDTVGPKGELLLSEEECVAVFGSTSVSPEIWSEYAKDRPFVSRDGPGSELAITLFRNRDAVTRDSARWLEQDGYYYYSSEFSLEELDRAFRAIAWMLNSSEEPGDENNDNAAFQSIAPHTNDNFCNLVSAMLSYLDERLCVPRDMGAPSAAALRRLRVDFARVCR